MTIRYYPLSSTRYRPACLTALASALLCLGVQPALAQQAAQANNTATSNQNVFTLGTIAVQGARQTEAEKTETVVDRETIDLLEKKDVGTALSLAPGVFYNRPQGGRYESNVIVRGYDLRSVPIFVDGIPVYIPYDGYSDLGRFTTADISEINVAKGYSSVMYGHNTLGGAINIVSLRPQSELDASAIVGTATGNVSEAAVNVGTRQENWYLQAGLSHYEQKYTRLAENFVGTDARGNEVDSDKYNYRTRDRRGSLRLGYTPNATDEYVVSYSKQEAVKLPGQTGSNGFVPTVWAWPKWDRETVSFVSNTRFLDNKFYIKPRVYYDKFDNTMDWWRGMPQGSHYRDKAFGASLELGTEIIENHLLKAMISYKDEEHRSFNTDIHSGATLPNTDEKVTQQFFSVALEDTWTISDHWETQIGALYTRRKSDASDVGINTQNLINQYPAAGSMLNPSIDTIDPQAALFYKPDEDHTWRASIARKTRFPSFKQAYSNYAAGSTARCPSGATTCTPGSSVPSMTLQNPGLAPEKAMHYELGYAGRPLPDLYMDASVYYSESKDAFGRTDRDFVTFPGYAVSQNVNLDGKTERKGLDLSLNYTFAPRLSVGLNYSYLHIRNKDDSSYRFTDMPEHFGIAYADIRATEWLTVTPSIEYRGSSYYDTKGEDKNPGYAITNLKFSVTPPAWKNATFSIGVENLFNKDYRAFDDEYASPGRSFFANLRVSYN